MISSLALWAAATLLASAGDPSTAALRGDVTGLQVLPAARQTEVVVALAGTVQTRDFTMEGPHRIVVDLMDARLALPRETYENLGIGGIQTIRASQYSEDIVRIVLELIEPAGYTLTSGDGYVRLSLENPWGEFLPWTADSAGPSLLPASVAVSVPVAAEALASVPPARMATSAWSGILTSQVADRISVAFTNTPIHEVLFHFAEFSNRSIVPGSQVSGNVSVDIRDQPWDVALQAILESHGLAAQELASGIIRVDRLQDLRSREEVEQLVTRPFRINYANAQELQGAVEILLSDRGRISVNPSTNQLVITDVPRVIDAVEDLIAGLDLRTPEVTISAKIIFVNRTDLQEFGITYDLKDSQGNQLNQLLPGGIDSNGDGRITEDEFVDIGTNVVSLGGNSIAALGNANQRVVGPSLQMLTSLILGRHTLLAFVDALQSVNLSDVQAAPQVTVLDNRQARILVGERTPIRVIDAAGGQPGQTGGQFAQATVQIEETGIILEVTPHVTAGDLIWMDLRAERSGLEIAEADVGFVFNTQLATTHVLVADGETVVIGGLTVTERTEVRAGIPLLQSLPLVGRFFRLTREQRNQRDLMILVTPQINRR